jgi:sulfur carrier protein ThiS
MITIAAIGAENSVYDVEPEEGMTVADALNSAGFDWGGYDLKLNGEPVADEEVVQVRNGDTIVAAKKVKGAC